MTKRTGDPKPSRCRALPGRMEATALFLILAAAAQPARAQTAGPPPQPETIEVTGSRIRTTDATSANPISIITAADIARTDATTVEQFLSKLPSVDFAGGVSAGSNYGGSGASSLGLRNLGAQRTLVLESGKRIPGTDSP